MQALLRPHRAARRSNYDWGKVLWHLFFGSIAYFICVDLAHAVEGCLDLAVPTSCGNFAFFDANVVDKIKGSSDQMMTKLANLGRDTFRILATIEFAYSAWIWVIEKDNLSSFMSEVIQKFMFIGFFLFLLNEAPTIVPKIVDSMAFAGATAAGLDAATPPTVDLIIARGLGAVRFIFEKTFGGILEILLNWYLLGLAVLVALIVLICHVIIAAQLLFLKIESFVLLAAGAIFLAFGGSRWTNEYVTKYLNYALTVGLRLMVLLIILGLCQGVNAEIIKDFGSSPFALLPLVKMAAFAFIQAMLAIRAPEMASALMSGGIGMSAGTASSAAKGVASAAVSGTKATFTAPYNAFKTGQAGIESAKAEGKTGVSAVASGLGMAGKQMAKEGGRSLMNKAQGKHGGAGWKDADGNPGHNKGFADRAKQNMQKKMKEPGMSLGKGDEQGGGKGNKDETKANVGADKKTDTDKKPNSISPVPGAKPGNKPGDKPGSSTGGSSGGSGSSGGGSASSSTGKGPDGGKGGGSPDKEGGSSDKEKGKEGGKDDDKKKKPEESKDGKKDEFISAKDDAGAKIAAKIAENAKGKPEK